MLAAEGCRLALIGRREELLRELVDELRGAGRPAPLVIVQDVTGAAAATRIAAETIAAYGQIDILINNAGGSRPVSSGFGSPEEWDAGMRLNFGAGRDLAHAVAPHMQAQKFGRIINLTGTDEALTLNAAAPPNGAVHIWAKALSRHLGKDGVTVNCIAPGKIHSEQIDERNLPTLEAQRAWVEENCPVGYIGDPEDVAFIIAMLASSRGRYVTGQVIHVDGGARRVAS